MICLQLKLEIERTKLINVKTFLDGSTALIEQARLEGISRGSSAHCSRDAVDRWRQDGCKVRENSIQYLTPKPWKRHNVAFVFRLLPGSSRSSTTSVLRFSSSSCRAATTKPSNSLSSTDTCKPTQTSSVQHLCYNY